MVERPNILIVCTDQQRADTLGCYGNGFVSTPNIDRLAGEGAVFENAFVQSPICSPSRGSFLTGRYPRTTRLRQNGQIIPSDEKLISRLLADAGYSAGLVGKFHLAPGAPDGELYDLLEVPMEMRNLWREQGALALKAEMLTRLTHRMAFTADPLPLRLSEW